jgi:hypothetical protein
MSRSAALQLHGVLLRLWEACHHRRPASVRHDLDLHRRFFDPVATGKRLRETLPKVDAVVTAEALSPAQAIAIGSGRQLITPEGRVALELLERALGSTDELEVKIDLRLAARWERELLDLYRDWGRHRLRSVVELLGGGDKPLQIPAIGATLTLLVNRADDPERAIKRFAPGTSQDVIDEAFRSCAQAFAQQLAPSERRSRTKERLISGWTLHEVTRRMPDALCISDEHGVFVVPGRRRDVIGLLVAELKRRRGTDEQLLLDAFDALVREFSRRAQALAGYGLLFERPVETARLRQTLLDTWVSSGSRA